MKTFTCRCGQRLYFENSLCLRCNRPVGFAPEYRLMLTFEGERWTGPDYVRTRYIRCRNTSEFEVCNWLVAANDGEGYCRSCRLNRTIPNLTVTANRSRWRHLESAKRRLIYGLLQLGLPFAHPQCGRTPLAFDFLEDRRSNPNVDDLQVLTGYANGVITVNVAEADDVQREMAREALNESYRTVLGHFRHESGHYYWEQFIRESGDLSAFRSLFGDEREDYAHALARYHEQGPQPDWQSSFISAYAQSHPLEDWAECWAHYLHMVDALDTAESHAVVSGPGLEGSFDGWLEEWTQLTVILNELNRSMGLRDAYPFVLSAPVNEKLRFIHDRILPLSTPR